MSNDPGNINLRLALDQSALQSSAAGVDDLKKGLVDLQSSVQDAGDAADKSVRSLGDAFDATRTKVDDSAASVDNLRDSYVAAADAAEKLAAKEKEAADNGADVGSGGGIGTTSLRRTGGALSQLGLGDIGKPIAELGALSQVMGTLGAVAESAGIAVTATGVAIGGMELATAPLLLVLSPVVLALTGLAIAVGKFAEVIKAGQTNLEEAIKANEDYYNAIGSSKTTEQISKELEAAQKEKAAIDAELANAQEAKRHGEEAAKNQFGGVGGSLIMGVGGLTGAFKPLDDQIASLQKKSIEAQASVDGLSRAIGTTEIKANDSAEAEKKLQAERDKQVEKSLALAKEEEQLKQAGSSKAVDQRVNDIDAEMKAINDALISGGLSPEKVTALKEQLADLGKEEVDLKTNVMPVVQAREAENEQLKQNKKNIDDAIKSRDAEAKRLEAVDAAETKHSDDLTKIGEENAQKRADIAQQGEQKRADIETAAAQKRADIEQQYADKQIDIANKAAQGAQDALTALQNKQQDLLASLGRDLEKAASDEQYKMQSIQVAAAEQEVKDATDHARKLQDIQKASQASDQQALLSRNFLALAQSKQNVSKQIDDENTRYAHQQQDAQAALQNKEDDELRSYAKQRADRMTAYQNQEQDAQRAYQRQLVQLETSKQRELQAASVAEQRSLQQEQVAEQRQLQQAAQAQQRALQAEAIAETQKLKILQQSYSAQLKLLQQSEEQKLQIQRGYQEKAAATQLANSAAGAAQNFLGGLFSKISGHAAGGAVNGPTWVNDGGAGQRESYNGTQFPPGLGLFIPAAGQSGNISPGGSSNGGNSITINVNGAQDPQAVSREVVSALQRVMG